jgi:hypothetical protein
MDKPFLQTLNLYRSKSALQISPSPELALVFVSLAPVIPGMENKMPDKNTKKYLWDKKLTASFNFEGALEVAAAAAALAEGKENLVADSKGTLPSWYRDPAKCGRDGNAKIIGFYWPKDPPNGSKVRYFLGITENKKDKQGNKIGRHFSGVSRPLQNRSRDGGSRSGDPGLEKRHRGKKGSKRTRSCSEE